VLNARQHVCELLCFCVTKHTYRIKYFILRNNVLTKVLKLAGQRDKCLVLAAMRFFRTCVGLKDDFYNRYIVKNRCFDPIIVQLRANCMRDNLVHSAILELFEFVRRENIKILVTHLAETYQQALASLTHVDIFKGVLLRHEQNEEYKGARGGGCGGGASTQPAEPPGQRRAFPDDDDDDAYFNESDDEEEPQSVPATEVEERAFEPRRPLGEEHEEKENSFLPHRRVAPQMELSQTVIDGAHRRGSPPPDAPQQTAVAANALGSLVSDHSDGDVESEGDPAARKRRRVEPEITD